MAERPKLPPERTSRKRYSAFVEDYRARRLDDKDTPPGAEAGAEVAPPAEPERPATPASRWLRWWPRSRQRRRQYIREYLVTLKPHRGAVAIFLTTLAVPAGAGTADRAEGLLLAQSGPPNLPPATPADLPLSCPMPGMHLWNSHPRVYLPIEKTGWAKCPYCSTEYTLSR